MRKIEALESKDTSPRLLRHLEVTVEHWGVYLQDDTEFDLDLLQADLGGTDRFIGSDIKYLLGLVDTVLVHCKRAEHQAKELVRYHGKNGMEERMEKLRKVQTILDEKVSELDSQIKGMQSELDSQSDLFQKLLQREERSNELNAKLYEADALLASLRKKQEGLLQKLAIQSTMNKNRELESIRLSHEIQVSEYKVQLLRKDLEVEMEIKPTFVHFTNSVQENCQTLESLISSKQHTRNQLNQLLAPVTKSGQRVQRDIIRKSVIDMESPSSVLSNPRSRLQASKDRFEDRNVVMEY